MACYLQTGIQTQWNIWDGFFHKNSWRNATLNNFLQKDPSYIPSQRFWIRLWSKALRQEIHIAYDILCCKSHLQMNWKKGKHFTPKKENSSLMSCFSFQTRKDLVLVKFYCNAVKCSSSTFSKIFQKICVETSGMETIFRKV